MPTTILAPQPMFSALPAHLVTLTEAQAVAVAYVKSTVGARFEVASGAHYFDKQVERTIWRFYVRGQHTPVGFVKVDALTGHVFPLPPDAVQTMWEKEQIATARKCNALPLDENGFVLAEYARRNASSYLGEQLGMYFGAVNPRFIPGAPPYWQMTIEFKMYGTGPFALGVVDVNAQTGTVVPIPPPQLEQLQEQTCAIIRRQSSAATGS